MAAKGPAEQADPSLAPRVVNDPGRSWWRYLLAVERAIPILPADDRAVAREFYVGKLGFELRFEASEDGRTGLLGVGRGDIAITLDCPMLGHGRQACVSLEVADADRYYAEWSARAPTLRPPRNEPWRARTFDLIDTFGNTISVMGPART